MKPLADKQEEQFTLEHERMLKEKAMRWVRRVCSPPAPGEEDEHVCPTYLQHMKWKNLFMTKHPFKMTGFKVPRNIMDHGDWMVSIDLKDAYLDIRLHPSQTKYQRYVHNGQVLDPSIISGANRGLAAVSSATRAE